MLDRSELSRLLAQAIANAQCGKASAANEAARKLVAALKAGGVDATAR